MNDDDPRMQHLRALYKAMYDWERLASRLDSLADNNHVGRQEADDEMRRNLLAIGAEHLVDFDFEDFVLDYRQPSSWDWDDIVGIHEEWCDDQHCLVVEHGKRYHPETWWFPMTGDRFRGRFVNHNGRLVSKLL